jgi:hypothetical protein
MSSIKSLKWMKKLVPFKFSRIPRGVVAHNFDLFHRDFLECIRCLYKTSPDSVMEWFKTPYLYGLLRLFSVERIHQMTLPIDSLITIESLGGFDEVMNFLSVPMKGETVILYKEYVQEFDMDFYTKKYLKLSGPIFFKNKITSHYHFDERNLRISQWPKKFDQYDLKKRTWVTCGHQHSGIVSVILGGDRQVAIPYLIMFAVEEMKKFILPDLIHMILSYTFKDIRDIEKYKY